MLVVYYTSCQYEGIHTLLQNHIENYSYEHIDTWMSIHNKIDLPIDILQKANIFIYNNIDKKHGKYSTDLSVSNNIFTLLNPCCIRYGYSFIRNDGYWSIIPFNNCFTDCPSGKTCVLENKHSNGQFSIKISKFRFDKSQIHGSTKSFISKYLFS